MAVTTKGVRAEAYFALGDELPRSTQLIDGEAVVNEPTARHQRLLDVALELGPGDTLTSPLLEDFRLDVAELFDR